jgi:hypothetical protein
VAGSRVFDLGLSSNNTSNYRRVFNQFFKSFNVTNLIDSPKIF